MALSPDERRERHEARLAMTALLRARRASQPAARPARRARSTPPRDRRAEVQAGWATRRSRSQARRALWLGQHGATAADVGALSVLGIIPLRQEAARRCAADAAARQRAESLTPNPRWRELAPGWHQRQMSDWHWDALALRAIELSAWSLPGNALEGSRSTSAG
jgi:hypothetical protein